MIRDASLGNFLWGNFVTFGFSDFSLAMFFVGAFGCVGFLRNPVLTGTFEISFVGDCLLVGRSGLLNFFCVGSVG